MKDVRVVFMGTPEFAVPSLEALIQAGAQVVGVVTQPDRPAGRGKKVQVTPVKQLAVQNGLGVYQFERLRSALGLEAMRLLEPDLFVTAAFGQILSKKLLAVPRLGTVNVHASLLPKLRGPAPINWAILNGETRTGVTIMLTDAGVDTGDMLSFEETAILENDTAPELSQRLSVMGAKLLIQTIRRYVKGEIIPRKQNADLATYYPMLSKELGRIDWRQTASQIHRQVRALLPWPGTYAFLEGDMVKVHEASPAQGQGKPGEVLISSAREGLIVACGQGALRLNRIQLPGSKAMPDTDYLRGHAIPVGKVFENA
jgi:methionyl-tRNA formyltransferase